MVTSTLLARYVHYNTGLAGRGTLPGRRADYHAPPLLKSAGCGKYVQCRRPSKMDQTSQTSQTSPQSSTNTPPPKKRKEDWSDLLLAFEDLQDHERREIEELEVRLKRVEDTQSGLLNVIFRYYQRCRELADRLELESRRVRGEIKRRTEALHQLETTPTSSTMKP